MLLSYLEPVNLNFYRNLRYLKFDLSLLQPRSWISLSIQIWNASTIEKIKSVNFSRKLNSSKLGVNNIFLNPRRNFCSILFPMCKVKRYFFGGGRGSECDSGGPGFESSHGQYFKNIHELTTVLKWWEKWRKIGQKWTIKSCTFWIGNPSFNLETINVFF